MSADRANEKPNQGRLHVQQVKRVVGVIEIMRHDDEAAHSAEDGLWELVLKAIAAGSCDDPAALATEALRSKDIDFARWCA